MERGSRKPDRLPANVIPFRIPPATEGPRPPAGAQVIRFPSRPRKTAAPTAREIAGLVDEILELRRRERAGRA
jgi:hypothetical protein